MLGRAEAQRVHRRDRARAHGEHVAQDAAHAGRRALVGLDEARVVVRFHLEDDGLSVADIDDAGILARPLDDALAGGRQGAQPLLGALVRAVLVPHRREDAELGIGRHRGRSGSRIFWYSSRFSPWSATSWGVMAIWLLNVIRGIREWGACARYRCVRGFRETTPPVHPRICLSRDISVRSGQPL